MNGSAALFSMSVGARLGIVGVVSRVGSGLGLVVRVCGVSLSGGGSG